MKLIYRCANNAEASVILNTLLDAGIPAVEGESGTSSVFPLPNFGPTIHVDDKDVGRAIKLLKELEQEAQLTQKNESFRDVDRQEIDYLQDVHTEKGSNIWIWLMAAILLLGVFRAVLYAKGEGDWFSRQGSNHTINSSPNHPITQSSNHLIIKSTNHPITQSSNHPIN